MNHKTWDFQYKADDESSGEFELYATVFGNVDRQGEVIEPGAIQNLDELVKDGWIALNHDQAALPRGWITQAVQDSTGLRIGGKWHTTEEAKQCRLVVRERMAAKKSVKCSIGYTVPADGVKYEKVDGRMVRRISKMSVYECSFVNLPANPAAEVLSAKAFDEVLNQMGETMADDSRIIAALKKMLGVETKAGRKMGSATLVKMQGYCKSMHDHADDMAARCKGVKAACKDMEAKCMAHKEMATDFEKSLKELTSQSGNPKDDDKLPEDAEGDEELPEDEDDEKSISEDEDGENMSKRRKVDEDEEDDDNGQGRKRRKVGEPEDTDDAAPPDKRKRKSLTADEKAEEIWRDQLRKQSLIGRSKLGKFE